MNEEYAYQPTDDRSGATQISTNELLQTLYGWKDRGKKTFPDADHLIEQAARHIGMLCFDNDCLKEACDRMAKEGSN